MNEIEIVKQQFPRELQNALGALIAVLEPISVSLIAHYASNDDGIGAGHRVKVEDAHVALLISVFQDAERKFGVPFLETAPVMGSDKKMTKGSSATEIVPVSSIIEVDKKSLAETQIGYKLAKPFQDFIAEKYPDLWVVFHTMFANRMLVELGLKSPQESREDLIPQGETLGGLIDSAAQKLLES
jgi:hypothetical protein